MKVIGEKHRSMQQDISKNNVPTGSEFFSTQLRDTFCDLVTQLRGMFYDLVTF